MATKTTGSGRGPGLETWDPNIKAPGITQRSGAYFSGEVAEIADYAAVNDNIQSSILQAAKDGGAAMKAWKDDPNNPGEANSLLTPGGKGNGGGDSAAETDRAIRKISKVATENTTNQLETIIPDIADEFSDDKRYARKTRKGKPITYKNLRKDHKILANQRANEISEYNGLIKKHIETGWQNADESTIDWGNWGNHTNAQAFMKHLIHGDAEYKYKFDPKSKGTVITWGPNNENSITKTELQVAQDMWGDNTDGVASFDTRFKADGELVTKDFAKTQELIKNNQLNPEQAEVAMKDAIARSIKNNYTYDDKEYLWNNVIANTNMFKDARNQKYNPKDLFTYIDNEGTEHTNQNMEFIIDNYLEGKLREYAGFPPKAQAKPTTNNNNNNNSGFGLQAGGAEDRIYNLVENLSKLSLNKIEFQEGDDISDFIPNRLSEDEDVKESYAQIKESWNTDGWGPDNNISTNEIKKIVEHGLANNGEFKESYTGKHKTHAKLVYDKWQDIYGDELGYSVNTNVSGIDDFKFKGEVGIEAYKAHVSEILEMSGNKLNGKTISGTDLRYEENDVTGGKDLIIDVLIPQGEDGLEAIDFNLSTENGRRALFSALLRATDSKYRVTDEEWTILNNMQKKKK
jgi:hypothetical protein